MDPCAYFKRTAEGITIIAVWVDDLLIFASLKALMNAVKLELQSIFEVTDLGEPTKIVGIEIVHEAHSQSPKNNILKHF